MPTNPDELLKFAQKIHSEAADEPAFRAVVSRSYYAALHCVKQTFEPRNTSANLKQESSHEEIIGRAEVYGKGLNPGRVQAGTIAITLKKFKRMRVVSDYELNQAIGITESNEARTRCERLFKLCSEIEQRRGEVKT